MKVLCLIFCLLSASPLNAKVISENVEELLFGQKIWTFEVEGKAQNYTLKARVYPPSFVQVNFWDTKKTPDNLTIFPTIEGAGFIEKALARYFARRGFWAVIPIIPELENPFDEHTTQRMDEMYLRVQQSALVIQEKLQSLNPRGRNFLMGASQGGIRSIMSAQALSHIDAIWANVAGGDFPSLYAYSEVDEIRNFRRAHMNQLNLKDPESYSSYLAQRLQYDPVKGCELLDSRLSLVVALEDTSVPTSNQMKLLESCQPDKVKKLNSGHFRGVIDLIFHKRDIRKFFEQS